LRLFDFCFCRRKAAKWPKRQEGKKATKQQTQFGTHSKGHTKKKKKRATPKGRKNNTQLLFVCLSHTNTVRETKTKGGVVFAFFFFLFNFLCFRLSLFVSACPLCLSVAACELHFARLTFGAATKVEIKTNSINHHCERPLFVPIWPWRRPRACLAGGWLAREREREREWPLDTVSSSCREWAEFAACSLQFAVSQSAQTERGL